LGVVIHDALGWWLAEAGPVEPYPALDGERDADVVVIGGGYAGMWTAWLVRELEPEARVVLLEAGLCGHGPSGRNGGFVLPMWDSLPSMRKRFGDVGALGVARASQEAVDAIGAWCEEQGVDAWYRRGGYMEVSTTPAHDGAWEGTIRACEELGEPEAVRALTPAEVAERCASPIFRGGAFFPGVATVQPARLALGLRERLAAAGVEVYERSRVRSIRVEPGAVLVGTDQGSVRGEHAVLTAGGAGARLRPLRRRLTMSSSHMVITEPVPDVLEELGWTGGEAITDCRHLVNYLRTTPDGRIAFGWGGGRVVYGTSLTGHAEVDPSITRKLIEHVHEFFPQLRGRRIEHAWGGPIDVSPSHTPIVGTLDGRVHYGFGFTGNGVGPSRMVARALASLALDRRDSYSRLAIVEPRPLRVPPEPFRYVGGAIVRRALMRREEAELADRPADPVTRFIASIPDRVGIQIGR
jgi:glycine/D-amino acid oxidase-like deaminating enzyme